MVEFNTDGSLKLPGHITKSLDDERLRMVNQRCVKVERDVISTYAPKRCVLHIILSKKFINDDFIVNIFRNVNDNIKTPMKIKKVDDKEFDVEVGSDFRRCTDCNSLISRYREFLDGNVIEKKGSCTFESRKNFCYEDHFD